MFRFVLPCVLICAVLGRTERPVLRRIHPRLSRSAHAIELSSSESPIGSTLDDSSTYSTTNSNGDVTEVSFVDSIINTVNELEELMNSTYSYVEEESTETTVSYDVEEIENTSVNSVGTVSTYVTDEGSSIVSTTDYNIENVEYGSTNPTTENIGPVSNSEADEVTSTASNAKIEDTLVNLATSREPKLSLAQHLVQLIFYSEIMCIAASLSCLPQFEDDVNIDEHFQAIVVASSNLWRKLSMMERVNDIYVNASLLPDELLREYNITSALDMIQRLPGTVFSRFVLDNIDASLKADPVLRVPYLDEVNKIDLRKLPTLEHIEEFLPMKSQLPLLVVNQHFLACADGSFLVLVKDAKIPNGTLSTALEHFLMARAVLDLSTTSTKTTVDRIQRIYDEAAHISVERCAFFEDLRIF